MITKIEHTFSPDYAIHPGESLLEHLELGGLSQADLAERTGRPKKTINEIIKGKAAITPETALQLERVLGVPSSFWNALEQKYRSQLAQLDEKERLSKHVDWLTNFPIAELQKRGLIRSRKDRVELVEELLKFFGVASPEAWSDLWFRGKEATAFRKSATHDHTALGLTATWLRIGEIKGRALQCESFDASKFKAELIRIRRETANSDINRTIENVVNACASFGVAVVLVPEFPKLGICGATRWLSSDRALIQLSLHYKRADHLWFSFFHEAGHILLHGKKDIFVEQKKSSLDHQEQEADEFARNLLVPPSEYADFVARGDFSNAAIAAFAETIEIAPGIIVGRLQHDKHLPFSFRTSHFVRLDWAE